MKHDELISVIIPAYNVQSFIEICIKSVLDQSHKNIEILIYNDGSTDYTKDVLEKWVKHKKVSVFNSHKNKGPSAARNFLFEQAQGEYIMLQDSDDRSMPDRIDKSLSFLKSTDFIFVSCNIVTSGGKLFPYHSKDEVFTLLRQFHLTKPLGGASSFFHRDVIEEGIRYDESLMAGEDVLLDVEVQGKFPLGMCGLPDKEPYYWYRRREGSLTSIRREKEIVPKDIMEKRNLKIKRIISKVLLDYKSEVMKYLEKNPNQNTSVLKEFYDQHRS